MENEFYTPSNTGWDRAVAGVRRAWVWLAASTSDGDALRGYTAGVPTSRAPAAPADPQSWARHTLTADEVAAVPDQPGVYVLLGSRSVVNYVGVSGSLRERLCTHIAEGRVPAGSFAYFVTASLAEAGRIEGRLIEEAEPRYNAS